MSYPISRGLLKSRCEAGDFGNLFSPTYERHFDQDDGISNN